MLQHYNITKQRIITRQHMQSMKINNNNTHYFGPITDAMHCQSQVDVDVCDLLED